MHRLLVATAGSGSALVALSAMGWLGAALVFAIVVVLTAAVGWVVNDVRRTERLAMLISALRGRPVRLSRDRPAETGRGGSDSR